MKARASLRTCISIYRGHAPSGKVHTRSHDKFSSKRSYTVDGMSTKCIGGLVDMFDNEFELFKSIGPHTCKHGLEIMDAKIFTCEATKTHTRLVIDPVKLAPRAFSVYSSVQSKIEKKLQKATKASDEYDLARKTFDCHHHGHWTYLPSEDIPPYNQKSLSPPDRWNSTWGTWIH